MNYRNSACMMLCIAFAVQANETSSKLKTKSGIIANLRQQILAKESELENAEKIHKNFERMIQLVNILGQIDTFLTDRTKNLVKKLAALVGDDDTYQRKHDFV